MSFKETLVAMEQETANRALLSGTILGRIDQHDDHEIAQILKQRRYLTFLFTPMCEYFLCSLDDQAGRDIVADIALEELGLLGDKGVKKESPPKVKSHRQAFLAELSNLRVEKEEALNCRPTKKTRCVMARMANYIFLLGTKADLEQLIFLRFSGEFMTGIEFKHIYDRLVALKILTRSKSTFLFPHLDYDVFALNGGASHADRYLPMIEERLRTRGEWTRARKVMEKAAKIRREFYLQFEAWYPSRSAASAAE